MKKKINSIPLLLLAFIYFLISNILNYSLFHLSREKTGHQYYLLMIYFFGEIITFPLFLLPLKKEFFPDYKLSPLALSRTNSSISESDEALNIDSDFENNESDYDYDNGNEHSFHLDQPFIGLKIISFLIPGLLDFLSKYLIINGIHILSTDSFIRPLLSLIITIILSKFILKINIDQNTKFGCIIILLSLILAIIYFQFLESIENLHLDKNIILGLSFLVIGELLSCFHSLLQNQYFIIGDIRFFKVVAFEGLYGFILSIILLLLAINFNCPFSEKNKYKDLFCNGKKFERDIFNTFSDFSNNNEIKWVFFYFFSAIISSLFSSLFIKYNGIISRVSIDCSGFCLWIFVLSILKNENLNLMSYIICFVCIFTLCGGMIISSEFGEYSIYNKKIERDNTIENKNE